MLPGTDLDAEGGKLCGDLLSGTASSMPVIGSPATSAQRAWMAAAFFFQGWPPAAGAAHALGLDVRGE